MKVRGMKKSLAILLAASILVSGTPAFAADFASGNHKSIADASATATPWMQSIVPGSREQTSIPNMAPLSQDYLDYLNLSPSERALVRQPSRVPLNNGAVHPQMLDLEELPAKYDARGEEYLTPVRDQMHTNTCWTFAAASNAANFMALKKGADAETTIFSTRHLEYSTRRIPGQADIGMEFNKFPEEGGSPNDVTGYLMRGSGFVLEEELPFVDNIYNPDTNQIEKEMYASRAALEIKPAIQVLDYKTFGYSNEDFETVPLKTMIDQLKGYIYEMGSCDIGMWFDSSKNSQYYNKEHFSYYCPKKDNLGNHGILAVGWDDEYSRENFNVDPGMDGAWIIQNSWGNQWGDEGFFYLSYADWSAYAICAAVTNAKEEVTYDNRYIYAPTGNFSLMSNGSGNDSGYAANIYRKQPGKELLTQITLGLSAFTSQYKIYVSPDGSLDQSKWEHCASGTADAAGYTTVVLDEPVLLTGDTFAVIIWYESPDYAWCIPVDSGSDLFCRPGISQISSDGKKWEDYSLVGYCGAFNVFTEDVTPKTLVTFEKTDPEDVIFVFDMDGRWIPANADGSYNLARGRRYLAQEVTVIGDDYETQKYDTKWCLFAVDDAEDDDANAVQTVDCNAAEVRPSNFQWELQQAPKLTYEYGDLVNLEKLSLELSFESETEGEVTVNLDGWQLAAFHISCNCPNGLNLTGSIYDQLKDDGLDLQLTLLCEGAYHRLELGHLTVTKCLPALNMSADRESYKPGDTVELYLSMINPYQPWIIDTLPELDSLTVTNSGNLALSQWMMAGVDDHGVPYYVATCEIPANTPAGSLTFSVASPENDYYLSGEQTAAVVVETSGSSGSSGGGGGKSTYEITVNGAEHGKVSVSTNSASRGRTVTLTVTPDEGYRLDNLTATAYGGNQLPLRDKGDGKYTFTMPAAKVAVDASFVKQGGSISDLPFADVRRNDWYQEAVNYVYQNGLMAGTSATTFNPDVPATRGMIATILWKREGSPAANSAAANYTDVSQEAYYREAIQWATAEGIVSGYGGGRFAPDEAVTREQLAVMLYRYARYRGYDTTQGGMAIREFDDYSQISSYAAEALTWAVNTGLIAGVNSHTLAPQSAATRAQVASILMKFMENFMESKE